MKKSDVVELLDALGAENVHENRRAGWVVSRCPLGPWVHDEGKSSEDVFGVKLQQGDPFVNCFACGFHDSATGLVLKIKSLHSKSPTASVPDFKKAMDLIVKAEDEFELDLDTPDYEEALFAKKSEVTVFDDWWMGTFPKAWDVTKAMKYLTEERGLDIETIQRYDIRWDMGQQRVCFPVRNTKQQFVGLHGRCIIEGVEPRYRMYLYKDRNNPQFWLSEDKIDLEKPVVITEGPFDAAAVWPVYQNVDSPLFANPSFEKLNRIAGATEIITFFDRGTGGDKGRERVDKAFGKTHVVSHLLPPENRKDPGVCTFAEIADLMGPWL